ncbi:uncharacterized protein LOC142582214 isoform X3 [Dermacentor variabilis]|uniref:uncharacterized protein LOC142582214 isoform X3 n=1 Tax=Dermacentor variabilis TaxID=34621 RepID=UPI003F5C2AC0
MGREPQQHSVHNGTMPLASGDDGRGGRAKRHSLFHRVASRLAPESRWESFRTPAGGPCREVDTKETAHPVKARDVLYQVHRGRGPEVQGATGDQGTGTVPGLLCTCCVLRRTLRLGQGQRRSSRETVL